MAFNPNDFIKANQKSNSEDYVPSEYLIKIGQTIYNEDTDQEEFISLPSFMGLDNIKPNIVVGSGEFQDKLRDGNDMLEALKTFINEANMEPGSDMVLTTFKVYIHRRKGGATSSTERPKKKFTF